MPHAIGKRPDGGEKCGNLLDVVADVICFLPDLHHDMGDVLVRLLKPGMLFVQLVAQNESQGFLRWRHFLIRFIAVVENGFSAACGIRNDMMTNAIVASLKGLFARTGMLTSQNIGYKH